MKTQLPLTLGLLLLAAAPACGQGNPDPMPQPIEATQGVVRVSVDEFATIPEIDGIPARMMLLLDEPGTGRLFVNDMRGPLYSVSYNGASVQLYLDTNDPRWGHPVISQGRERGVQSFAFHPQFGQPGTPGFGKFYTYTDTSVNDRPADFTPGGGNNTHHTVLLEWTARNPAAATYDGDAPREVIRFEQPFNNHNAGHMAFRPVPPSDPEFGFLYMGVADGGSGGDPLDLSQNLASAFGKVFRIDPLGTNSANGKYGIPADNPFVGRADDVLPEIWALGVRNPQRFGWDPQTGAMYLADIGQNTVEELSPVPRGGNLGWRVWEGSFRFSTGGVDTADPRSDPAMVYPIAEYDQTDPLLQNQSAATGVHVVRGNSIPALNNRILWGDFPSGEIFHVSADTPPQGFQDQIRRVLLVQGGGEGRTLLQLIQAKNTEQGRNPATRADLRFGTGPNGQLFLLNKGDGTIRRVLPN